MRSFFCLAALLLLPVMNCDAVDQEAGDAGIPRIQQVTGDAATTNGSATRRTVLEQRVTAKWDALIHRNFAAAYEFASPAYREAFSLDAFKRNFGSGRVSWQRIEVVSVDFKDNDSATVGITIHIVYHDPQSQQPLDMATNVQESWVRSDGQWWYVVKE